jgi:hypothetical protein
MVFGGYIILMILSNGVYSELPPWVYEEWRRTAQEVLFVQATGVASLGVRTVRECREEEDFLVTALVLMVNKTSTMIDQDDNIEFYTYDVYFNSAPECEGWVGPSWPVSVDVGWCGTVYLNLTNSSTFSLAAGGKSLETTPCITYSTNSTNSTNSSTDDFGSSCARDPRISEGLLSIVMAWCLFSGFRGGGV